MTITLRTVVLDVPPSPMGLVPRRIIIEHYCKRCRRQVATEDLAGHARDHDSDQTIQHEGAAID